MLGKLPAWLGGEKNKTFKPLKLQRGGVKPASLAAYAKATLGSGDLAAAVALPEGEAPEEWCARACPRWGWRQRRGAEVEAAAVWTPGRRRARAAPLSGLRAHRAWSTWRRAFAAAQPPQLLRARAARSPRRWAVHIADFYNESSLLYGAVSEYCTRDTCPAMTAGPRYEYR